MTVTTKNATYNERANTTIINVDMPGMVGIALQFNGHLPQDQIEAVSQKLSDISRSIFEGVVANRSATFEARSFSIKPEFQH